MRFAIALAALVTSALAAPINLTTTNSAITNLTTTRFTITQVDVVVSLSFINDVLGSQQAIDAPVNNQLITIPDEFGRLGLDPFFLASSINLVWIPPAFQCLLRDAGDIILVFTEELTFFDFDGLVDAAIPSSLDEATVGALRLSESLFGVGSGMMA